MITTDGKSFRNAVTFTSFILTVLVIYIHSQNLTGASAAANGSPGAFCLLAEEWIVAAGQIAVPGFFLLSGFLNFRKMPAEAGLNRQGRHAAAAYFGRQYRKKIYSLLVPYLLWNAFYMLIYLIFLKEPLTLHNLLEGIFCCRYNPVFWYMKQLMLLTLLAPLIWVLIRNRFAAVFAAACLFLLAANYEVLPVHPVNEDALFYFTAGAAAGLHVHGFSKKAEAPVSALLILCLVLYRKGGLYTVIGTRVLAPAALFLVFCGSKAAENDPPAFMKISFFIYAFHFLVVRSCTRIVRMFWGEHPVVLLAVFLIMPVFAVACSYLVSLFLRKYLPRLWRVITGGR